MPVFYSDKTDFLEDFQRCFSLSLNKPSPKMWTFKAKDLKAKKTMAKPLVCSQMTKPLHPYIWMDDFPGGLGQIGPSTNIKLACRNKLLETSISVWGMNIKQYWGWKQYITRQVPGNKQKAGSRPGKGAKILVKDNSSWRNDSRFEDSRYDLKSNDINYILKMRRRQNVVFICLSNNRLLFWGTSFLDSLNEMHVMEN